MAALPAPRRDPADAQLAGVCAALARSWNVQPSFVRTAMVLAAILTGGFAIAAYLILWALIPRRGDTVEPIRRLLPFTREWSRGTLYAVVIATIAGGMLVTGSGPGALVIAGILWLVLHRRGGRHVGSAAPLAMPSAPRTEFERLSGAWQQRLDNVEAGRPPEWDPQSYFAQPDPAGIYGPPPAAASARPPAARRRGRRTWFGILTGVGVAWTVLAVLAVVGRPVPLLGWVAAALAVLSLALVLVARPGRAVHGRPPGLVSLTVVTMIVTAVLLLPRSFGLPDMVRIVDHGNGSVPVTVVQDVTRLGVGDHPVDLSGYAITADREAVYTLAAGTLTLHVPAEGNVVVRSRVDVGSISTPVQNHEGLTLTDEWRRIGDPDAPTLTIVLEVNVGEVVVRS